jgi:hypothetical protein
MSIFKKIGYGFKVFFSNPIKYIYNSDAVYIEYRARELTEAGKTKPEVIAQLEEEFGIKEGPGPVVNFYKSITGTADFLVDALNTMAKNLPLILIVFGVLLLVFYGSKVKRVLA